MSVFTNPASRAPDAAARYVAALLELLGDRDPLAVQRELISRLRELTADLSDRELRLPERPGKWSILQVLDHLADQEIVSAFRLRSVIAESRPPLRGYDQDLWGERLRYGDAPLSEVLEELATARRRSIRLYESLSEEELDRFGVHAERGEESARHLRALMAAHDLVHRRQIARIRAALGGERVGAGGVDGLE